MSDMKEKLVGIINNHCHDNYYTDPDGAAEAIIAALPDMVKPLEWARAHVWGQTSSR